MNELVWFILGSSFGGLVSMVIFGILLPIHLEKVRTHK